MESPKTGGRDVWLDNIKGLLIFLVVFGHVMQKYIHNRASYIYIAFVIIYCFHMPLFVFLSGYFSKDASKARDRAFERFLLPYIVWELVWFIVNKVSGWNSEFNFAVPWFAYWYFVSLFTLCLLLPVLARIRCIVPLLFILALVSGLYTVYGSPFSLGRTICFSGFFMLGYFCDRGVLETIRKHRIAVLVPALLTVTALILICLTPYVRSRLGKIERSLWMAEAYRSTPIAAVDGLVIRSTIIIAAFFLGAFVIAVTPRGKSYLSRIGKNSLTVFVLHGFFVEVLNRYVNLDAASFTGIALIVLVSLGITLLLSIEPLYRVYCRFMGIVVGIAT
ncbi:MAG: acyltransferase family protein [Treponema sp.]|jgi:fucose 4-O-acetylase-like acetyltransferase|nr:acyltransferase family protein [Treponema sp.]